jgi:catechol 2,3-dioxygenase-like lactoylglutathione lyase family enzyme
MTLALQIAPAVRFHLSLNVADLERSVAFYRILFGCEPAKCRRDYAKFELDDPPLVISLEPTSPGPGGALNHLGFRMSDSAALVAVQMRLERAGIRTKREEGVECCYARQTKFCVTDPDQTLWEMYTLDEDIDHRGTGQTREQMLPHESE